MEIICRVNNCLAWFFHVHRMYLEDAAHDDYDRVIGRLF